MFGASGLGGGSLINAGVVLRPDLGRLRKPGWPDAVVSDGLLLAGLARAEAMLGVAPVPGPERFAKFAGMRKAAEASGRSVQLPSMTISHSPGPNVCGRDAVRLPELRGLLVGLQRGRKEHRRDHIHCRCGRSWRSGVLRKPGPVDLQDRERLGDRRAGSVEGGAQAIASRRRSSSWRPAHWGPTSCSCGRSSVASSSRPSWARSSRRTATTSCSPTISTQPVNAVATGFPPQAPRGAAPVGPHSMALIDLGDEHGPLWVHDGTMLAMMAALAPLEALLQLKIGNAIRLLKEGIYGDEMSRSQLLYVVAHDDASGRLRLQNDHVIVDWPGYSDAPERVRAEQKVKAMIESMGACSTPTPSP